METRFTHSHEWIFIDRDIATIGITENALDLLGDIVHVNLPKAGTTISKNDELCNLDSIKSAIEIYSPISGTVTGVNHELESEIKQHGKIQSNSPWIAKIKIKNPDEFFALMSDEEYTDYLKSVKPDKKP